MFSLPIPEDIYDLDTFSLEDLSSQLPLELQKKPNDPIFNKKARKIMDLIELELKERKMVENFGNFCLNIDNLEKIEPNNIKEGDHNKKESYPNELQIQPQKSNHPSNQTTKKAFENEENKRSSNPFIKKTDSNQTPPKTKKSLSQDKFKHFMDFQEYEEMEEKKNSSNKKSLPSSEKKKNVSGSLDKESISVNFAKEKFRFIPSTQKTDKMLNFMREVLSQTKIQQNVVMIGKAAGGKYKNKPKKKKKEEEEEGGKRKDRKGRKEEGEEGRRKEGGGRMAESGGGRRKEGGEGKKGEGGGKKEEGGRAKEEGGGKKEGGKKERGEKEDSKSRSVVSKESKEAKGKDEKSKTIVNNGAKENKLKEIDKEIIGPSSHVNKNDSKEKKINEDQSDTEKNLKINAKENYQNSLLNYNNQVISGFDEKQENEVIKSNINVISTENNSSASSSINYVNENLAQNNKSKNFEANNLIKTIYNQNLTENAFEKTNGDLNEVNFDKNNSATFSNQISNKKDLRLNSNNCPSNNSEPLSYSPNMVAIYDLTQYNSNKGLPDNSPNFPNNINLAQTSKNSGFNGNSCQMISNEDQTAEQDILDFQAKYRDSVSQPVKFNTCLNNIEELEESYAESAEENQSTANLPSVSETQANTVPFEVQTLTCKTTTKEIASSSSLPRPPSSSSSLPPPPSSLPLPPSSFPSPSLSKTPASSSNIPPPSSSHPPLPSSSHPLSSNKKKNNDPETKKSLKNSKLDLQNTLQKYQPSKKDKKKPPVPPSSLPPSSSAHPPHPSSRLPPPPPPPVKLSPLFSMSDEEIVDYSEFYPSFNSIISFSYVHDPQPNLDLASVMKEICLIFHQHVQKIDKLDKLLSKYRPTLAPLELNANDRLFLNDNKNISYYAYRTNLDLQSFLARQKTFEARIAGQLLEAPEKTLFFRVIKNREEVYDIITKSFLRKENWVELMHGEGLKTSWNLIWTWSKPQIDMGKLVAWQKVNHFPMNKNMVRKDLLKKNIEKIQRLGPKTANFFNFIPLTFVLPKEYCQFMEEFYKGIALEGSENIWIMKPIGKSRGRGISLVNDISKVVYAEQVILQKYLKNPLLLRGLKFDLRIYVLVTSLHPLEAFIYKEGFGRLSTVPFSLDPETLDKQFIHLTNYSIQKNNMNMSLLNESEAIFGGSKISLKTVKSKVEERGYCWARIWAQIQEIAVKTLLACQGEIPKNPNCFELFGFDVIIDDEGKCWLLEVNSSPSLSREYILDDIVKQQLIDDTIDLVDPILFDRERLVEVLERRIKEDMGVKSAINTHNNSKQMLNRDLTYILGGKLPRKIGEMPKKIGNYERIAPSEFSDKINKIIQSYKCPNTKNYATIDY